MPASRASWNSSSAVTWRGAALEQQLGQRQALPRRAQAGRLQPLQHPGIGSRRQHALHPLHHRRAAPRRVGRTPKQHLFGPICPACQPPRVNRRCAIRSTSCRTRRDEAVGIERVLAEPVDIVAGEHQLGVDRRRRARCPAGSSGCRTSAGPAACPWCGRRCTPSCRTGRRTGSPCSRSGRGGSRRAFSGAT